MEFFLTQKLGITDPGFSRLGPVETYKSCIWTERYSSFGDFEMVVPRTDMNSKLFARGRFLESSESNRMMMIETLDYVDGDDEYHIKVKGRSLEAWLTRRVVRPLNMQGPSVYYKSTDEQIMVDLVNQYAINPSNFGGRDVIPGLRARGWMGEFRRDMEIAVKNGSLYSRIKEIADSRMAGFRIVQEESNPTNPLVFEPYIGTFRAHYQNGQAPAGRPVVAFGRDLENLLNSNNYYSEQGYYNTAVVMYDEQNYITEITDPRDLSGKFGAEKRVLLVEAGDIKTTDPGFIDLIKERALAALAENNLVQLIDGEIASNSNFVYNRDYGLGDVVEIRDAEANFERVRVSEYMWSVDEDGIKQYPTLDEMDRITA